MKNLRQLHLYLGCIFAPMIIYFSLSGAWQVFRFNNVPKDEAPSLLNSFFHELSKPHTNSTMPGANPKADRSAAFNWISFLMAFGLVLTTVLGLMIAFQYSKSRKRILFCIGMGIILPIILLLVR